MIFSLIVILFIGTVFSFPKFKDSISDSSLRPVLSLLVAVRNEQHTLPELFKSMENQVNIDKGKVQIVFINDHSEDESEAILKKWALTTDYDVLVLNLETGEGKKQALRKGVDFAKHDVLLFTDADCKPSINWVENSYGQFLEKDCDMLIGTVWFSGSKNWFERLQEVEFAVLQAVTAISTYSNFAFMCNGANLMTKKYIYINYLSNVQTSKFKSGDDVFYLDYLIQNNKNIAFSTVSNTFVETNAMAGIKSFVNQRLRWSSKVKFYKNIKMIIPSGVFTLWSLLIPLTLSAFPWIPLSDILTIILTKILLDWILLKWFYRNFKRSFLVFDFLFLEIIHPIYVLGIGILSIFKSFNWKNREAKA